MDRIEENCTTIFNTLNLGLFANLKKNFWRLSFRNPIWDRIVLLFTEPKKVLGIIPATAAFYDLQEAYVDYAGVIYNYISLSSDILLYHFFW